MPSRLLKFLLLFLAAYFLYLYGLNRVGMLSADEPRYAAIAQSMAASGDWITPRLWGSPWFEKPVLLYWMAGLGFLVKLPAELAARLPVALTSIAFLVFYRRVLAREFGCRESAFATAILATSAGWLAFSNVAVTDLPMSAAFSAAMLLAMPWAAGTERGRSRSLYAAGALLGVAALAKSLVPVALAAPLGFFGWRRWRDGVPPALVAIAVAVPWYAACYLRNGWPFIQELFVRHQLGRTVSAELGHVQPWWFYLPVMLAALFPWTPCAALLADRACFRDPRLRFLSVWVLWGLLFFSAVPNKLPGYLLPLVPAAAALVGIRLAKAERAGIWLGLSAVLASLIPLVAHILPGALAEGLSSTAFPAVSWIWPAAGLAGGAAAYLGDRAGKRPWVVIGLGAAVVAGVAGMKVSTYPVLDEQVSARATFERLGPRTAQACSENVDREFLYGLDFYADTEIPDCAEEAESPRLTVREGKVFLIDRSMQ